MVLVLVVVVVVVVVVVLVVTIASCVIYTSMLLISYPSD